MKNFKQGKSSKGITLVALVVTIVVLLILAGVSLNLVVGQNGLIAKAKDAKSKTEQARTNEDRDMSDLSDWVDQVTSGDGENGGGSNVEEIKSKLKVGDYVNYTYDPAEDYSVSYDIAGSSSNISQDKNLKWRVLYIHDDGRVDLISETATEASLNLYGALGYNNGVYILDDICADQYSNQTLGVTARNLKIEDIEKNMNSKGKDAISAYKIQLEVGVYAKYGESRTYNDVPKTDGGVYKFLYPKLYTHELEEGIGVSDKYYNTPTKEEGDEGTVTAIQTGYDINKIENNDVLNTYFDNEIFYSMVFRSGDSYYLSSRYVNCHSYDIDFGLRGVYSWYVEKNGVYQRYGNMSENHLASGVAEENNRGTDNNCKLRPVVTLKSGTIDLDQGKNEDGTWQIKTK